ncbi:MAG: glycosyltransferase family 2 protein [Pyrinomonadaceae bacterium]|nr:glycosyltransferase family 2 protein [Pyrinomonadaceae bacterium]
MLRPAISVVIPTFNRAVLAVQAVQSVFAQTFSPYEVIVVDDGSTDNTNEVLAAFKGAPNFRYHYQPNSGRSTARNQGFSLAQGDFILFLDSDDLLFPDALAQLYGAAQNSAAGMIVGQVQFADEQLKELWLLKPSRETFGRGQLTYPSLITGRYFLLPGAVLLRREVLRKVAGFDRTLEPCEDYDFYLRIALICELTCIEGKVLQYRMHGGNTDMTEIYEGGLKVARRHLRLLAESESIPASLLRASRANWMLRVADNNYNLRRNLEALKHYLRALMLQPALVFDLRIGRQILASLIPVSLREGLKSRLHPNKGLADL